jgi:hypothetical protein
MGRQRQLKDFGDLIRAEYYNHPGGVATSKSASKAQSVYCCCVSRKVSNDIYRPSPGCQSALPLLLSFSLDQDACSENPVASCCIKPNCMQRVTICLKV